MSIKLILNKDYGYYNEVGQPNPILWTLLQPKGPDTFENISNELKCKDYFNDVVVKLQTGSNFAVYGFDTTPIKLDKNEAVPVLVSNLVPQFKGNLEVFNAYLEQNNLPSINYKVATEGFLLFINPWYWKQTYRISLLTLIIRLLNNPIEFNSFDKVKRYTKFPPDDQAKWKKVVEKGYYFHIPEKWNKYIWYCGDMYNSEKNKTVEYQLSTMVHNNGILSWYEAGV